MDSIFEVTDKSGKNIRMTRKQHSHLMKKHSYMSKYLEEIKETIKNPDVSKVFTNLDVIYLYKGYKNLKKPNKYILVIVKYLNGDGFIITAYLESKIK